MQAWLLDSPSGVDSLRFAEVDPPSPAGGEVILSVHYAALNPADRYLAEGAYPARPRFPHILGRDGLGTITSVGPGVNLPIGAQRLILRGPVGVALPGTFAEKVAVPAELLVQVPPGWSDRQAAGAPLVYLTAYQALTMWSDLPPSALVLVSGASGGVGVACVQLAKAMGHAVIALSRDPSKQARLRELGADVALSPDDPQWPKSARDALGGCRVDLAIDNIGGTLLAPMIDSLADHGRVSCVGRLAGPVPQFNTASLFFRRLRLGGVAVGAYGAIEANGAWLGALKLLSKTGAKPLVDSVFAFGDLKKAFARLAAGPMGKVLLSVAAAG